MFGLVHILYPDGADYKSFTLTVFRETKFLKRVGDNIIGTQGSECLISGIGVMCNNSGSDLLTTYLGV